VAGSRAAIQERFGVTADFFCYPYGRFDAASPRRSAAGYLGATTTRPGSRLGGRRPFALDRVKASGDMTGAARRALRVREAAERSARRGARRVSAQRRAQDVGRDAPCVTHESVRRGARVPLRITKRAVLPEVPAPGHEDLDDGAGLEEPRMDGTRPDPSRRTIRREQPFRADDADARAARVLDLQQIDRAPIPVAMPLIRTVGTGSTAGAAGPAGRGGRLRVSNAGDAGAGGATGSPVAMGGRRRVGGGGGEPGAARRDRAGPATRSSHSEMPNRGQKRSTLVTAT
jgi:hypothetical protein